MTHPPSGRTKPSPAEVEASLDRLLALIDTACAEVSAGNDVNLEGLDDHIDRTCKALTKLPGLDRTKLSDKLEAMTDKLEVLAGMLRNATTDAADADKQPAESEVAASEVAASEVAARAYRKSALPGEGI